MVQKGLITIHQMRRAVRIVAGLAFVSGINASLFS